MILSRPITLIVGALLIFTACATPYGPRGSMGGYESRVVGENMLEVSFYGNQHTSRKQIVQSLLYRCAEMTQEKDMDSFVVLKDQSYSKNIVNNPTIQKPFKTVESQSVGVRTVVSPDLTQPTKSTDLVGVYVIAMFNNGDSPYSMYQKSRFDVNEVLSDYKSVVQ